MKRTCESAIESVPTQMNKWIFSPFPQLPFDAIYMIISHFDSCDAMNSFLLVSKICASLITDKEDKKSWFNQQPEQQDNATKTYIKYATGDDSSYTIKNPFTFIKFRARNIAFNFGYENIIKEQNKTRSYSERDKYYPMHTKIWWSYQIGNHVALQQFLIPYNFEQYSAIECIPMISAIIARGNLEGMKNLLKNYGGKEISMAVIIIHCLEKQLHQHDSKFFTDDDKNRADILSWCFSDTYLGKLKLSSIPWSFVTQSRAAPFQDDKPVNRTEPLIGGELPYRSYSEPSKTLFYVYLDYLTSCYNNFCPKKTIRITDTVPVTENARMITGKVKYNGIFYKLFICKKWEVLRALQKRWPAICKAVDSVINPCKGLSSEDTWKNAISSSIVVANYSCIEKFIEYVDLPELPSDLNKLEL